MKNSYINQIALLVLAICSGVGLSSLFSIQTYKGMVTKNRMTVSWQHDGERIFFEMSAPTQGWVTIGFNNAPTTSGSYLLMGNVINHKAQVVEHYTFSPGNYKPFELIGKPIAVDHVTGGQVNGHTTLKFSLPIRATNDYARNFQKGKTYELLIAYSLEDDFQHHSIMRTFAKITL